MIKVPEDTQIPLIGLIHLGIIDRGTDLLQVRIATNCNLNCTFCATNHSIKRNHFTVKPDYLITWIKEAIKLKNNQVTEIHLDSVGEVLTNKKIIKIIKKIKALSQIKTISMQTNGTLLTKEKIKELEKAGLNRINLSIHTLNNTLAKKLSSKQTYNLKKILTIAKEINNSKIELLLAPVWLPNINDKDIEDLIKLAKRLNCKIGIQNYLEYPKTKKQKGVKKQSWFKFYNKLKSWEKEYNIKLKYGPLDFNNKRTKKIPLICKRRDKLQVKVISKGWNKNQCIATYKHRAITIHNCSKKPGDRVTIKITETKNSIYLAKPI